MSAPDRQTEPVAATRSRAALCLAAVIGAGLASRRWPLPGGLAEHTGDALYTTAAFCALRVVATRSRGAWLAAAAFAWSGAVEASQLLRWDWLVALRGTTLGALLLGQGFQWIDLTAYAAGALVALLLDFSLRLAPRTRDPR